MAQKIRPREVTAENTVSGIPSLSMPLEGHLEDGLESNTAALAPDLLVIGLEGVFRTTDEVAKFVDAVQAAARNRP